MFYLEPVFRLVWFNCRTLINQLYSSVFWCVLLYDVIVIPMILVYYMAAPVESMLFCKLPQLVALCVVQQGILLFDAIVVVKYFFIFLLKNPTAVQDDFWKVSLISEISMFIDYTVENTKR